MGAILRKGRIIIWLSFALGIFLGIAFLLIGKIGGGEEKAFDYEIFSYDDDTSLDFIWDEASGNPDFYKIYVSKDGGAFEYFGQTETNSCTIPGEDRHIYKIKVQAGRKSGEVGPMSDESDPVMVVLPIKINLSPGKNLISLPLLPKEKITAFSLIQKYGIKVVSRWDKTSQSWKSVFSPFPGLILGEDFELSPFEGVFIETDVPVTIEIAGRPKREGIQLVKGYNVISIADIFANYTSFSWMNLLEASQISRWNSQIQNWESAFSIGGGVVLGKEFNIKPCEGYLVKMDKDKTWLGAPKKTLFLSLKIGKKEIDFSPPLIVWGKAILKEKPAIGARVVLEVKRNGKIIQKKETMIKKREIFYIELSPGWKKGDEIDVLIEKRDGRAEIKGIKINEKTIIFLGEIKLTPLFPKETRLLSNFPNPFNSETWIPFMLASGGKVKIKIFDSGGRLIKEINLGFKEAGWYLEKEKAVLWDGRNNKGELVASGIYICCLEVNGEKVSSKKMILLR